MCQHCAMLSLTSEDHMEYAYDTVLTCRAQLGHILNDLRHARSVEDFSHGFKMFDKYYAAYRKAWHEHLASNVKQFKSQARVDMEARMQDRIDRDKAMLSTVDPEWLAMMDRETSVWGSN